MEQYRYGKHPVEASITQKRVIKIFLLQTFKDDAMLALIKQHQLPVERVEETRLFTLANSHHHQGIVAQVRPFAYHDFAEILTKLDGMHNPVILLLDGLEDPLNFGNIIRTAVAFGVAAIFIKKDRQVLVNATVAKIASGALDFVPIVQVTNLSQTIETLKSHRFWIVATALVNSNDYRTVDYRQPIAIVVGHEGSGISRLVLERSDYRVKIPIASTIESLNAATSVAVMLAEVQRQRFPL
jgi:23S rRNA (guanosine2251-2'-O)-methyltransferase